MSELFEWFPPSFIPIDAWNAFVENRHHIAKVKKVCRWTDVARDRAVIKLTRLHQEGVDVREVLLTAAEFGWQDVDNAADHVRKSASRIAHSKRELATTSQLFVPTSKRGATLAKLQSLKRGV